MDKDKEQKIKELIEKIRPFIKGHGGDVQLEKVEGETAVLTVTGTCVGCSLSHLTYDKMLNGIIKEQVPEIKNTKFIYKKLTKINHGKSTGISS